MDNKVLSQAITVFDNAGLEVVKFEQQDSISLFCVSSKPKTVNTKYELAPKSEVKCTIRFPGETRDICQLVGAADWREAISTLSCLLHEDRANHIHVGDFIFVSFEVPEAEHKGVRFKKLKIESAKVIVVERTSDKIIFNFDEIIFKSAINAQDTNEGGFSESALSCYLNTDFLEAMGIEDSLCINKDAEQITLLTAFELFGKTDYWKNETNFNEDDDAEPHQFNRFKSERNRVKDFENETHWYWTSSARSASSSHFCVVSIYGGSYLSNATAVGGVAPAFCVA